MIWTIKYTRVQRYTACAFELSESVPVWNFESSNHFDCASGVAGGWYPCYCVATLPLQQLPGVVLTDTRSHTCTLLFHLVHCGLLLCFWIQEHQGFSRDQNVAAHALQRWFCIQEVGIRWCYLKEASWPVLTFEKGQILTCTKMLKCRENKKTDKTTTSEVCNGSCQVCTRALEMSLWGQWFFCNFDNSGKTLPLEKQSISSLWLPQISQHLDETTWQFNSDCCICLPLYNVHFRLTQMTRLIQIFEMSVADWKEW